jgi:hypothetical protein
MRRFMVAGGLISHHRHSTPLTIRSARMGDRSTHADTGELPCTSLQIGIKGTQGSLTVGLGLEGGLVLAHRLVDRRIDLTVGLAWRKHRSQQGDVLA